MSRPRNATTTMDIENFKDFAEKYDMLPQDARVLCAVSGGADSVCLLHLLKSAGVNVVCAHFNHRLRGAESDRDEEFVRALCRKLGVELFTSSGDVAGYAAENAMGTEEAAREMRYAFLFDTAEKCGADRIATAHNAEDNAETVIMNLARGAGLRGICGIPPRRGKIIRPLLQTTRDEIIGYLRENGLEHVEDSTNAADDYARNRLRHRVLPVLRQQNAGAVMNIARACELFRADEAYFEGEARRFIEANRAGDGSLPVSGLTALPGPVRARVFALLCPRALSAGHVRALSELCGGPAGSAAADVPGLRVLRQRDRLYFGAPALCALPETVVEPDSETVLEDAGIKIISKTIKNCAEINKSFNTFHFKNETICGRILFASKKDGAKVRLEGRGCTKSLKKLFREAGLTQAERRMTPVLYDGRGVIAVYGFGVDERCACAPGDDVIKIEVLLQDGRG